MNKNKKTCLSRRGFIKNLGRGAALAAVAPLPDPFSAQNQPASELYHISTIPDSPFIYEDLSPNTHAGIESLLYLMGARGLKFYRADMSTPLSGRKGLINRDDVVLIKVNAQWKYRGCTNSDLVRGLIQRILEHPDGFSGEVVIVENGQGRGSLDCNTQSYRRGVGIYPDRSIQANANRKNHSFTWLSEQRFKNKPVSTFLLDHIRENFIENNDHRSDGYRISGDISYPCFTTAGGHRVELKEGIWNKGGYSQNLKLINVPVLKHHDKGGSEITGAVKHFYGLVSMSDGRIGYRHYSGLGRTCAEMILSVRTPVLNIMDAIWVSHRALKGYPAADTFRANQIVASQDPLALDYWSAAHILYPIDRNRRHHPDFLGIERWMTDCAAHINRKGGLKDLSQGIQTRLVTHNEAEMQVSTRKCRSHLITGRIVRSGEETPGTGGQGIAGVVLSGLPGNPVTDKLGRFRSRVIRGWSGKIRPKKSGMVFTPPAREISEIAVPLKRQDFTALPQPSAPANLRIERTIRQGDGMGSLIRDEIRWDASRVEGIRIRGYRIYETTTGRHVFLAEVSPHNRRYARVVSKNPEETRYTVAAVLFSGREGETAEETVR